MNRIISITEAVIIIFLGIYTFDYSLKGALAIWTLAICTSIITKE